MYCIIVEGDSTCKSQGMILLVKTDWKGRIKCFQFEAFVLSRKSSLKMRQVHLKFVDSKYEGKELN